MQGELRRAHVELREALDSLNCRRSGKAIDRINPLLLQLIEEWRARGYTVTDLDLL
jgi:hypothetical protein